MSTSAISLLSFDKQTHKRRKFIVSARQRTNTTLSLSSTLAALWFRSAKLRQRENDTNRNNIFLSFLLVSKRKMGNCGRTRQRSCLVMKTITTTTATAAAAAATAIIITKYLIAQRELMCVHSSQNAKCSRSINNHAFGSRQTKINRHKGDSGESERDEVNNMSWVLSWMHHATTYIVS